MQKCPIDSLVLKRFRDSSPTGQFTDTYFGDSSPTHFETVHRRIWRQFTDTFFFKRMFMSMEIMFHILIEENVGKLTTEIL